MSDSKDFKMATRRAFEEAWQFEQAAELLQTNESLGLKKPGTKWTIFVPWIVNSAFALEVYLKCLYGIEYGCFPRGHALLKLYRQQKKQSKKVILDSYNKDVANEPESARQDIVMILRWASTAFEKYRYLYEDSKPAPFTTNVGIVCKAVRERIIRLKPTWENYLRNNFA